jgi:hypothetical protein
MIAMKRSLAKAMGLLHYSNGKPCPAGHLAERFVSTGTCRACLRAKTVAWQAIEKNKEHNRKSAAMWALANPEKRAANERAWRQKNAEKLRALDAIHRASHRIEHCVTQARRNARKKGRWWIIHRRPN